MLKIPLPFVLTNHEKKWDYYKIALVLLLLIQIWASYSFVAKDKSIWGEDASAYYNISIRYYHELCHANYKTPLNLYRIDPFRHSIFMYLTIPIYWIFGVERSSALYTNFAVLIILIFSIYGIGKSLKDSRVGLLSATIVMLFPGTFCLSRMYLLDFALTAMVSLSVYLLIKSDCFRNNFFSYLFGLSCGIGMLVKIPFVIFIIVPFIYMVHISLKRDTRNQQITCKKNIAKSSLLWILIPMVWYVPAIHVVVKRIVNAAVLFGLHREGPYLKNLFLYLSAYRLTSLLFAALFIYSIFRLIRSKMKNKTFLILWTVFPLLFLSLSPTKSIRYALPVLPSVSIIISAGILSIETKWWRRTLIAVAVFLGVLQYYLITYKSSLINEKFFHLFNAKSWDDRFYSKPIDTRDWHLMNIINCLKEHYDPKHATPTINICVFSMDDYVWNLISESYRLNLPFSIQSAGYVPLKSLDVDFVLVQDGGFIADSVEDYLKRVNESKKIFEKNIDKFKLIETFQLPNKAKLSLYQKI